MCRNQVLFHDRGQLFWFRVWPKTSLLPKAQDYFLTALPATPPTHPGLVFCCWFFFSEVVLLLLLLVVCYYDNIPSSDLSRQVAPLSPQAGHLCLMWVLVYLVTCLFPPVCQFQSWALFCSLPILSRNNIFSSSSTSPIGHLNTTFM